MGYEVIFPNWDFFFYYDNVSVEDMDEFNLQMGLLQPTRSLLYFRQEGAGVQETENMPNTLNLFISLRYNIARWAAFYNGYVVDGDRGFKDRRIAVSQNFINIEQQGQELNVDVFYIPFMNYKNPQNVRIPIG